MAFHDDRVPTCGRSNQVDEVWSFTYAKQKNVATAKTAPGMHIRRLTRLTNAFCRKLENHACAAAQHMMCYNFVCIHSKLRMSPAMATGVLERLWEIGDIVALIEATEEAPKKRGPYKKRAQISD